jgi:hypothetical protein
MGATTVRDTLRGVVIGWLGATIGFLLGLVL